MATLTMGTAAQTSLTAIQWSPSPSEVLSADMATIKAAIKDDLNPLSKSPGGWIDYNGLLMIPRRGQVRVFRGDFIGVDPATGWPILVSAAAAAQNPQWVHTGSAYT